VEVAKKVVSNTGYLFMDTLTITFFGYLFWLIMSKMMHPWELGNFSFILNVAMIVSAFTVGGVGLAVSKIVPQYVKKQYVPGSIIGWSTKLVTYSLVPIIIIAYILFNYFNFSFYALFLYLLVHSFFALTQCYLVALSRMKDIFFTNLVAYILKVSLAFVLIYYGFSYFGPIIAFILSSFIAVLLRLKKIDFNLKPLDGDIKKKIIDNSIPAFVSGGSWIVITSFSIIILPFFVDMNIVGIFSLSMMISTLIRMVSQSISTAMLPIISEKFSSGDNDIVSKIINSAIRYSYLFTIPAVVFIMFFPTEIVELISTSEYVGLAIVLQILALSGMFSGFLQIFMILMYSIGRIKHYNILNVMGAILIVVLSIIFGQMYGVVGVALSYFAALASMLIYSYVKLSDIILLVDFFVGAIKVSIVSLISIILPLYIYSMNPSLIYFIVSGVLYVLSVFVMFLLIGIFDKYDVFIISRIERKLPKNFRFPITFLKNMVKKTL
jgi:O-antigen/teichoic acid export membrane protein